MFGFLRSRPAVDMGAMVARVARGEVTLVDVRDAAELARTGRARDALHIPLSRLPMMADPRHPDFHAGLDPAKPVALYCASGARSGQAKSVMERLGFTDVSNIGSLSGWQSAGGAISRG